MRKNGSIYMLTLTSALVLVSVVLGSSYILNRYRQTARIAHQVEQVQIHAELGIRHALSFTRQHADWRNLLTNGTWLSQISLGPVTYDVSGIDPDDGKLFNGQADPVLLTCTAVMGDIYRTLQVRAQPGPSELLAYAGASGSNMKISEHAKVTGNVASNAKINKTGADTYVYGNAEAVSTIHETSRITGVIAPGGMAKVFPDSQAISDYYLPRATAIPFAATIEKQVISNMTNTMGAVNSDGLYVIDCQNKKIVIKETRIQGTLVLVNPKNDSEISACFSWQSARSDYPALIVLGGDIEINSNKNLSESELKIDFSLPGENGYGTQTDVYPPSIIGGIYSDDDVVIKGITCGKGPIIVLGCLEFRDNTNFESETLPLKAFLGQALFPVRGTWQWLADVVVPGAKVKKKEPQK